MALTGPSAWANGVIPVGNGTGPGAATGHDIFVGPPPFPAWLISLPAEEPIPVVWDPDIGPWTKELRLMLADGSPFAFHEGDAIPVVEFLTVGGSTPWTDWHEEILTPGWEWVPIDEGDTAFLGSPDGIPAPGLIVDLQPTTIDFFFDPILPGTDIAIAKFIIFVGVDPGNPEETTLDSVFIAEYPTVNVIPEPATVTLGVLSIVAAGSALRRRLRDRST